METMLYCTSNYFLLRCRRMVSGGKIGQFREFFFVLTFATWRDMSTLNSRKCPINFPLWDQNVADIMSDMSTFTPRPRGGGSARLFFHLSFCRSVPFCYLKNHTTKTCLPHVSSIK
jgi:hypothetical protein